MTPPAPPFRRVAAQPLDVDDDALMKFSDDHGIPALVRPEPKVPEAAPSQVSAEAQNLPKEKISTLAAPTPAPRTKKRTTVQKSAPSVDPVSEKRCRVSIDILPMLDEQLRRRIFEERASQRYFLLSGLKAIGFDVPDSELARDARREDRS